MKPIASKQRRRGMGGGTMGNGRDGEREEKGRRRRPGGVCEIQTLKARNLVHQNVEFCSRITLKLTYEHLQVKNFPGAKPPDAHTKEKGWEGRGGEKGEEGKGNNEEWV
jgi:hypothetical protein